MRVNLHESHKLQEHAFKEETDFIKPDLYQSIIY